MADQRSVPDRCGALWWGLPAWRHALPGQRPEPLLAEDQTASPTGECGQTEGLQRGDLARAVSQIAREHPDKDLQLWFEDEARVGQKGRATHVWFEKGVRPTAPADKRFASVNPGLGREGARYLASLGVAMAGADTSNFEVIPFEEGAGV